jgi:hypothetical protein
MDLAIPGFAGRPRGRLARAALNGRGSPTLGAADSDLLRPRGVRRANFDPLLGGVVHIGEEVAAARETSDRCMLVLLAAHGRDADREEAEDRDASHDGRESWQRRHASKVAA